ncbi:M23 family metallopeptidase [Synechococcus sp. M16CYN]|uniref:M23 family metallopeptidase n=1 Tax=Synechococcus sp. M16CYN TaxID=3103139 RepID=UPI00324F2405
MRALLLLVSATSPLITFLIWSNLPGQADNNTFNPIEPPLLSLKTSQPSKTRALSRFGATSGLSVWFQLTRKNSLTRLATTLGLHSESLAELNNLPISHVFGTKSWIIIPDSVDSLATRLVDIDYKSKRISSSLLTPLPVSSFVSVPKQDSLTAFLFSPDVTQDQLKDSNPGFKLNAPAMGHKPHIVNEYRGKSPLAIHSSVNGQARWSDHPSFNSETTSTKNIRFGRSYLWPTKGVFTSGFGWRWGRMHKGIDIANNTGTPIFAARDGVVVFAGWSGAYGYLVEIAHGDGASTRYAHNSRILVDKGQIVPQGSRIALMGSTGRSTGPHLHFEIRHPGGAALNPLSKLPARRA